MLRWPNRYDISLANLNSQSKLDECASTTIMDNEQVIFSIDRLYSFEFEWLELETRPDITFFLLFSVVNVWASNRALILVITAIIFHNDLNKFKTSENGLFWWKSS